MQVRIREMSITKIKPAPYNPRIELEPGMAEYEKLKRSIEEFGLVEPLIYNEKSGYLVGGHQRLRVLTDLGWNMVPVTIVSLEPAEEMALNAAMNKISGDWDMFKLKEFFLILEDDFLDSTLTGFDEEEIEDIIKEYIEPEPADDPIEPEALTKPGDTWQLGFHRLIVGDEAHEADALIRRWQNMTGLQATRL